MTNTRQQVGVVAPLPAVNNTDITCKINRLQTTVPTVHFVKNRTEPLVPQFCQEQDRIPCSYFLCGDLSIRSLRQIPRNAIPHKNAVFIDTECGGYYSIRGFREVKESSPSYWTGRRLCRPTISRSVRWSRASGR